MSLLQQAIEIATKAHAGQYRKGVRNDFKVPYIVHPFEVMKMLWDFGFGDEITLSAAILHDSVEDNKDNPEVLESIRSLDKYLLTEAVMKLSFIDGKKEDYIATFAEPSMPIIPLVVKMADRICNVRDYKLNNEGEYSKKYLNKGNPIYEGYQKQWKPIIEKWGVYAYQKLFNHWYA